MDDVGQGTNLLMILLSSVVLFALVACGMAIIGWLQRRIRIRKMRNMTPDEKKAFMEKTNQINQKNETDRTRFNTYKSIEYIGPR